MPENAKGHLQFREKHIVCFWFEKNYRTVSVAGE